jgi:hypothetical protein
MWTPRIIENPRLTERLVDARTFADDELVLVDVGASGGIDFYWDYFEPDFRGVGFDPLVAEVDRLNAENEHPGFGYEAAFATCPEPRASQIHDVNADPIRSRSTEFWMRASSTRAEELAHIDYAREHFNAGAEVRFTDRRVVVDEYAVAELGSVDFVKIDTDGADFEVLLGCERLLGEGCLGVAIEVRLQGAVSPHGNTFSNIDVFMRDHGFTLYDIECYRYSRAALPAPFLYDIPAQTTTGQVWWGDALYFRDLGDPAYEAKWNWKPTRVQLLKTMCLLELFGMPDCAAEIVHKYGDGIADDATRRVFLDALASSQARTERAYDDVVREFEQDVVSRWASSRGD